MKRFPALILVSALLINIAGCARKVVAPVSELPRPEITITKGSTTIREQMAAQPNRESIDYTMRLDSAFYVSTGENTEFKAEGYRVPDYGKTYPTVSSLCGDSDGIVVGTVLDVWYTDENASALTYYDLLIEECWEGPFAEGDRITVGEAGGYIRGDVFFDAHGNKSAQGLDFTKDDVIRNNGFGSPEPKHGDRYVVFLQYGAYNLFRTVGAFWRRV